MTELYWISRLDAIHGIFVIMLIISVLFVCIAGFVKILMGNDANDPNCFDDDSIIFYKFIKKFKLWVIIMVFSLLGTTLIPKTNDAYIIYGVGSTIDYVKKDSTARQLPHKAIIALDKYLETIEDKNIEE